MKVTIYVLKTSHYVLMDSSSNVAGLVRLPAPFEHVILLVDVDADGQALYQMVRKMASEQPKVFAAYLSGKDEI